MDGVEEVSIARVVVDVPVTRTDRPFDYRVPSSIQGFVQVGSRVMVPFGPRKLQGFVIELSNETQFSLEKVRNIEEVLDIEPPLTPELVQLAKWMSERYMSTYYGALQVMIPSALRSKYEKRISLIEKPGEYEILPPGERECYEYLDRYSPVSFETFLKKFPFAGLWVKEGIKTGVLKAEDNLIDRLGKKMITLISPARSIEELIAEREGLGKRAYRQREILSYFIEGPPEVSLPQLLADLGTSSQTVKSLLDKELLKSREIEDYRDPFANRIFKTAEKYPFTPQQEKVIEGIDQGRKDFGYFPSLIHGVTGSGKTEVYLEIMERTIAEGKEAILLVPEISLTPQMVNRFKGRLGDKVAVMHSALSQGERYDEWRKIRRGQVRVAIGARSAIFAPFTNLGLIIIDEEHEGSYKQEETPRYHARSVAHYRGRANEACVILGSATPSMESYDQAVRGKITLFTMADRVANRPLPQVEIVDMRGELRDGNRTMFSKPLREAIEDRLERQEQMVMLMNRRGFSTFVMCRTCGFVAQCPHCDISLTFHRTNHTLRCHYCGYTEREPTCCPSCESEHIRYFGTGTQRVEEELAKHFPGIRVIRMDVDTTSRKGSHEKLLQAFREGKGDILLGTQMIAKGLDFPNVTLVGVLAADSLLNLPDFRSGERTFQLLTQVGGRAGRHEKMGEVIIQTYNTEHYSILMAANHDYSSFFQEEIKQRYQKGYPPFSRLILFTFSHENVPLLVKRAERFAKVLREMVPTDSYVLGPVASPIGRIKDRYRFQCMLKYSHNSHILHKVYQLVRQFEEDRKKDDVSLTVDVDPQVMM